MPESEKEITKLRQIKWKSPLSRKIEEFTDLISDDEIFEQYFGESYINDLATKSKAITGIVIKLGIVYTALMVSLYASQNIAESEFEILGYGFKNLEKYKEFLLLLASIISPISAVYSAYQKYIKALIGECIKKVSPNEKARKYYSLKYIDEYFDWLPSHPKEPTLSWHGVTGFLMASLGVILILLFFTLIAGSFFIQINVIYDIAANPSSAKYINIFVLVVSISAILLSWLIALVQLPMPEIDISNYLKLDEIKENDPEKYQAIMRRMAKESSRKEAVSILVTSSVIYIATYTMLSVFWFSESLDDMASFLVKAIPGVFWVLFFSNEIMGFMRARILNWFFAKYPEESANRLNVFGKVTKVLVINRILIPLILTAFYGFYALGSSPA
ncbi:hypothetical protein [Spongiibacter tropicus]|uniref:hypothetical protein n=1 Tax=Spongiibacter tropicus TaxID=454602 RepID=UPI0003B608CC|nr:hypothetical protein [Spongiibacter tropicus]